MSLSAVLGPVMKRSRRLPPSQRILAALAKHPVDTHHVRAWLIKHGPADVAAVAADDYSWRALRADAALHRAESSSGGALRRAFQRGATHVLRPYFGPRATPARVLKARTIAALALHDIAADERGYDSWLATRDDIAATLGISKPVAASMLRNAVDLGVLTERMRASNGARRFGFAAKPRGYEPTAVEKSLSASLDTRDLDALASVTLSIGHPAWNYDDDLGWASWWGAVRYLTGGIPRDRVGKGGVQALASLTGDPSGFDWEASVLDQRRDAVVRAAEARAVRAREAAERAAEVAAYQALEAEAKSILLDDLKWPAPPRGLRLWSEAARLHIAENPPRPEVGAVLWKLLKRRISLRFPDHADEALRIIATPVPERQYPDDIRTF